MPEAQLTEPLDHAAEKGGVKETFAALEGGGRGRRRRVPPTRKRECAGLRDPLADSSPSSARHGDAGRPGGWGAAFVAAIEAEVDALIGPGRADAQDFEALEQALRRQAPRNRRLDGGTATERGPFRPFGFDDRRAPADRRRATPAAAPRRSPRCWGR